MARKSKQTDNAWRNMAEQVLAEYGSTLIEGDIIGNQKGAATGVRLEVKARRMRFVSGANGSLLMSGPVSPKTVSAFVERYWFWKRVLV